MQQDQLDYPVSGAGELTEQDLAQIQGGNFLGDAWNWVEQKATDVWNAIVDVVNKLPSPIPFPRPFPPQKPPLPRPLPRPF